MSRKPKQKTMRRWDRTPGVTGGTVGAFHRLAGTRWQVIHCGHATALWPYYIHAPDGRTVLNTNGRGFQFLDEAKRVTELLATRRARIVRGPHRRFVYAPTWTSA